MCERLFESLVKDVNDCFQVIGKAFNDLRPYNTRSSLRQVVPKFRLMIRTRCFYTNTLLPQTTQEELTGSDGSLASQSLHKSGENFGKSLVGSQTSWGADEEVQVSWIWKYTHMPHMLKEVSVSAEVEGESPH